MSKWDGGSLLKLGAGLVGAYQQYDHGKDMNKRAKRNAKALEREAEETRRRESRSQKKKQSTLRSRAAASGIKLSGSTKTFLDDYINEDEKQLSWLSESAKNRASILRKEGKSAKRNSEYGAYGSFFKTASSWLQGG